MKKQYHNIMVTFWTLAVLQYTSYKRKYWWHRKYFFLFFYTFYAKHHGTIEVAIVLLSLLPQHISVSITPAFFIRRKVFEWLSCKLWLVCCILFGEFILFKHCHYRPTGEVMVGWIIMYIYDSLDKTLQTMFPYQYS